MNFEDALQIAIEDKGFPDIEYANEVLKSAIGIQENRMSVKEDVFLKFIESTKTSKDFIEETFLAHEDAQISGSLGNIATGKDGINGMTKDKEKLEDMKEAVDGNVMAATDVPYRKGTETDGEATEKLTDETTPPISSKDFDDIDINKKNPEDKKVTENTDEDHLQDHYVNFEEYKTIDDEYDGRISKNLGYNSSKECWDDNPKVIGDYDLDTFFRKA